MGASTMRVGKRAACPSGILLSLWASLLLGASKIIRLYQTVFTRSLAAGKQAKGLTLKHTAWQGTLCRMRHNGRPVPILITWDHNDYERTCYI